MLFDRKIQKLTPKQEALIPDYRRKWKVVINHTQPLERQKAIEAVKSVYGLTEKAEPLMIFYSHRGVAQMAFFQSELNSLGFNLDNLIREKLLENLERQIENQFDIHLWDYLTRKFREELNFWDSLQRETWNERSNDPFIAFNSQRYLSKSIFRQLIDLVALFDFCVSELHCSVSNNLWSVWRSLVENCSLILRLLISLLTINTGRRLAISDPTAGLRLA